MRIVVAALALALAFASACTVFDAGATPCDQNADCVAGDVCTAGFCVKASASEGEAGEGEGARGEGEGAFGEGEGVSGEGEGAPGEGEGVSGEGEGEGPVTVSVCPEGAAVVLPTWFDTNFTKRESLGLCDVGAPDVDVVDLPVTVVLDANVFNFAEAKADGSDIFFVDGRTNQVLPFEKALYAPTDATGAFAAFFVKVPAFNPHRQTDSLWMYWDNPNAASKEDVATTWNGHAQVWHMDKVPSDGSLVGNQNLVVDTVTGATAKNSFANQANNFQGAFVFGNEGLLGNALILDAGGVGCSNCVADSFAVLPPPPNLTANEGSISVVVGSISETDPNNANNTKTGVGGSGCANGAADCGHLWLLGETSGSTGFDTKSIHVTAFGGGNVGVSRPSNPSTAGGFSAQTSSPVLDEVNFSVVSTTWTASEIDVTVTTRTADGSSIVQNTISSARAVVPFNIDNFVLGVAENNTNFAQSGDLFGSLEEVRVSTVARDPAFIRAEAAAHLSVLVSFGPEDDVSSAP